MKRGLLLIFLMLFISLNQIAISNGNYHCTNLISSFNDLPDHEPIYIDADADFATLGFPGEGSAENPYKIENYHILADEMDGIYVTSTTKYFLIQDCLVEGQEFGIYLNSIADHTATIKNNIIGSSIITSIGLWHVNYATIEYNTVSSSSEYGIDLDDSSYNSVKNNNCNTPRGIRIKDSSNNNKIENNICDECNYAGIEITDSDYNELIGNEYANSQYGSILDNCENTIITGNEIHDNSIDGINLESCPHVTITENVIHHNADDGIYLYCSDNFIISENEIYSNDWGIYLTSCFETNIIRNNLIQSNIKFGIEVFSSEGICYHNTFKYNGDGSQPQAMDNEGSFTWYDEATNEGNFWSDWDGTGEYEIAGPPGTNDPYPLSEIITTTTKTSDTTNGNQESSTTPATTTGYSFILILFSVLCIIMRSRTKGN